MYDSRVNKTNHANISIYRQIHKHLKHNHLYCSYSHSTQCRSPFTCITHDHAASYTVSLGNGIFHTCALICLVNYLASKTISSSIPERILLGNIPFPHSRGTARNTITQLNVHSCTTPKKKIVILANRTNKQTKTVIPMALCIRHAYYFHLDRTAAIISVCLAVFLYVINLQNRSATNQSSVLFGRQPHGAISAVMFAALPFYTPFAETGSA